MNFIHLIYSAYYDTIYRGEGAKKLSTPKKGWNMAIKYDKLFMLFKEKGYSSYRLRQEKLISQAVLQKLRSGKGIIDSRTVEKLCNLLNCQPGDIMEYVADEDGYH